MSIYKAIRPVGVPLWDIHQILYSVIKHTQCLILSFLCLWIYAYMYAYKIHWLYMGTHTPTNMVSGTYTCCVSVITTHTISHLLMTYLGWMYILSPSHVLDCVCYKSACYTCYHKVPLCNGQL